MKITKIEKQKKAVNRYNIFIDGEFAFGLYTDTITDFGLRVNDELNEKQFSEIRDSDEFNFGKKTAFDYLSYKARSKKDVHNKLKEKKISGKSINKIIDYLEDLKYIDDKSYAKTYLESSISGKPAGKKLLMLKLLKKGIDKELAEEVLKENFNDAAESENAKKLLLKYFPKIKQKDKYEIKKKCFTYLMSRGFDYETINLLLDSELESAIKKT